MAAYDELKSTGVTEDTPKNIILGAGTIHKGLEYSSGSWNFATSLIGATQGGSKISIKPELKDIEADGALVKVKGLTVKVGETATMEVNFLEITPELLKHAVLGKDTEGSSSTGILGYNAIESKLQISSGDYISNLGFIGKTLDGKPIVVIFDNALCTSGMDHEQKHKDNAVMKLVFECYADMTGDMQTLPYHIYYPTPTPPPTGGGSGE